MYQQKEILKIKSQILICRMIKMSKLIEWEINFKPPKIVELAKIWKVKLPRLVALQAGPQIQTFIGQEK
jgi:hypothetical protein